MRGILICSKQPYHSFVTAASGSGQILSLPISALSLPLAALSLPLAVLRRLIQLLLSICYYFIKRLRDVYLLVPFCKQA